MFAPITPNVLWVSFLHEPESAGMAVGQTTRCYKKFCYHFLNLAGWRHTEPYLIQWLVTCSSQSQCWLIIIPRKYEVLPVINYSIGNKFKEWNLNTKIRIRKQEIEIETIIGKMTSLSRPNVLITVNIDSQLTMIHRPHVVHVKWILYYWYNAFRMSFIILITEINVRVTFKSIAKFAGSTGRERWETA